MKRFSNQARESHRSGSCRAVEMSVAECAEQSMASPRWILVLDDDLVAGRSTVRWVRHVSGMAAQLARTIHQAECWLRAMPPPTVVIADFELQFGENGVKALQRLRSLGCSAQAAIVTGAPELALLALEGEPLAETVPVFSKTEFRGRLRDWLVQVELSWALPA